MQIESRRYLTTDEQQKDYTEDLTRSLGPAMFKRRSSNHYSRLIWYIPKLRGSQVKEYSMGQSSIFSKEIGVL